MLWWTKVHKADINKDIRAIFELYGEEMIATVLATRKQERLRRLSEVLAGGYEMVTGATRS